MRKTFRFLTMAVLAGWCGGAVALAGPGKPLQAGGDRAGDQGHTLLSAAGSARSDEGGETAARKQGAKQSSGQVRRLVSRLGRLHKWMKSKLDLDDDQQRSIRGLFKEHLDELRSALRRSGDHGDSEDRAKRLQELQEEMREAREQRDQDLVNQIRHDIRDLLRKRHTQLTDKTARFLERLEEELADDQIEPFEKLVDRLGLGKRDTSHDSIQDLLRIVLSPEVGLSAERRQAVMDIMRDAFLVMDPDRQAKGQLTEVTREMRAEIIGELTEAQWAKVEALLQAKNKKKGSRPAENKASSDEPEEIPDE